MKSLFEYFPISTVNQITTDELDVFIDYFYRITSTLFSESIFLDLDETTELSLLAT